MTLEEATAIRRMTSGAPKHLMEEAARVVRLAHSMSLARQGRVEFAPMSKIALERTNSLLAYRLALAVGKFDDWREAA